MFSTIVKNTFLYRDTTNGAELSARRIAALQPGKPWLALQIKIYGILWG